MQFAEYLKLPISISVEPTSEPNPPDRIIIIPKSREWLSIVSPSSTTSPRSSRLPACHWMHGVSQQECKCVHSMKKLVLTHNLKTFWKYCLYCFDPRFHRSWFPDLKTYRVSKGIQACRWLRISGIWSPPPDWCSRIVYRRRCFCCRSRFEKAFWRVEVCWVDVECMFWRTIRFGCEEIGGLYDWADWDGVGLDDCVFEGWRGYFGSGEEVGLYRREKKKDASMLGGSYTLYLESAITLQDPQIWIEAMTSLEQWKMFEGLSQMKFDRLWKALWRWAQLADHTIVGHGQPICSYLSIGGRAKTHRHTDHHLFST